MVTGRYPWTGGILRFLLLFAALILLLPFVLLFAAGFYLRALYHAVRVLILVALGKDDPTEAELQRPHFLDVPSTAKQPLDDKSIRE